MEHLGTTGTTKKKGFAHQKEILWDSSSHQHLEVSSMPLPTLTCCEHAESVILTNKEHDQRDYVTTMIWWMDTGHQDAKSWSHQSTLKISQDTESQTASFKLVWSSNVLKERTVIYWCQVKLPGWQLLHECSAAGHSNWAIKCAAAERVLFNRPKQLLFSLGTRLGGPVCQWIPHTIDTLV